MYLFFIFQKLYDKQTGRAKKGCDTRNDLFNTKDEEDSENDDDEEDEDYYEAELTAASICSWMVGLVMGAGMASTEKGQKLIRMMVRFLLKHKS